MASDMAEVLREAIRKCGKSAIQLSSETGVSQPTISEFLRGKDIRVRTADRLATHLGLKLTPAKSRR